MVKYKGYEIYAVNTLGEWFGMIYDQDNEMVYETLGYTNRDFTITLSKMVVDSLNESSRHLDSN